MCFGFSNLDSELKISASISYSSPSITKITLVPKIASGWPEIKNLLVNFEVNLASICSGNNLIPPLLITLS